MNDLKFTTAGEYMEDHRWMLSPHGRDKQTAKWVVDNYDGNPYYEDDALVQRWVAASKQVLEDPTAPEGGSLYVGSEERRLEDES